MLYCYDNKLKELPESIGDLTNITELDCSHNQLTKLPESLRALSLLSELLLGGNRLDRIIMFKDWAECWYIGERNDLEGSNVCRDDSPQSFSEFVLLGTKFNKKLDLSLCNLGDVPPNICEARRLTELDLSNSFFGQLPDGISNLESLQALDVSNNDKLQLKAY
jgi:Leucine-rich repeat (LRR) protein